MLIEAVVTDLDGTLVRSDFSMSPATLEALDRIHAAGVKFVIATARTPQGLAYLGVPAHRVDEHIGGDHYSWLAVNLKPDCIVQTARYARSSIG